MKIPKAVEELLEKAQRLELDNKKIILVGLIAVIVLYLDFSFIISPQIQGIKRTGSKIAKLKQDINNLSSMAPGLKTAQAKAQESAVGKDKIIISENQVAPLLQKISDMANKDNVKIMQIKPGKESKAKDSSLATLLINLDLVCGYHNLGLFINDIENGLELMAIEGVRIESDPVNYLQQRVNLTVKTYVKK